jgi:SAM-dependent methyltransferase
MATQYKLENTTETYSKVKHKFSRQILDKLQVHLSADANIIEVGPGAGHFAQECKKRGYRYTAVESSAPIQAELESMGVAVIDATIPPVPLGDDSVDLFFASMVLEHMPSYTDAIGFVEEAKRILKPEAILCLTFPNAYTCGKIFWEMDYTHSYFTTPRRVSQLCRQSGLEVIEVQNSIGWFWVHSTPMHDVLRHLSNIFAAVINNSLITGFLENVGLGKVLWKFRKTFFESSIVIVRKP